MRMAGFRQLGGSLRTETWLAWPRFAEKGGENGLVIAGGDWAVRRGPPWSFPCQRCMAEAKKTGGGLWFTWARRRSRGERENRGVGV